MTTPTSSGNDNGSLNPAAAQLILQSQALMMQMLDLQKWQQQVALKFVDAHQQLLMNCAGLGDGGFPVMFPALPGMDLTGGMGTMPTPAVPVTAPAPVAAPVSMAPVSVAPVPVAAAPRPVAVTPVAAPVPVAVAAPTAVAAAPIAVTPAPVGKPVAVAAPMAMAAAPVVKPVVATVISPAVTASVVTAPAAPATDGVPTPADFERDLLEAVSERTGYPIEMLDLNLPMEAGLGIDSIKTVEIFSNLKTYHAYFQQDEQDEEEALKEFTKLKTLGDIIGAYQLRYEAITSGGGAAVHPAGSSASDVERYTLKAMEAPAKNGQKKTSRVAS